MCSFVCLFGILVSTIYMALMYNNEALVLVAFMEAAFFVVSLVFISVGKSTVNARLCIPVGIAEKGREHVIKIDIENGVSIAKMKVYIQIEDSISGICNKGWMTVEQGSGNQTTFIGNVVFKQAGKYQITFKKLRIYDVTGLMYGTMKIKDGGNVYVLPDIHEIPIQLTLAVKNFYGESEVYDLYRPGYDNSEILDIREYRKGDRLQNVHWKMTAKQDELMVKEHALPRTCPVVFLLECGIWNKKNAKKKKEVMRCYLEVAASLSFSVMEAGCPHYVAWYDAITEDIQRVRVDDEESLFAFINYYMNGMGNVGTTDILQRYKEKYKNELYVWMLMLNQELELKKGEELLAKISKENIRESLYGIELLL